MFRVFWLFWNRRHALAGLGMKSKAVVIFVLLLWYATSGFLYFELPAKPDLSWLDALWWAVVTMATVGYGDLFPVTPGGRYLVGIPTMVFGIGFLGYLISEIAGTLLETRSRRIKGMLDLECSNHILIVHFNYLETALKLIRELRSDAATRHKEICFIDENLEELPQELLEQGAHFVRGDPTRPETLKRAGLLRASHVLVLNRKLGDPQGDDRNLVVTLVIESLNPDIHSVVEIQNWEKIPQVKMAGANSVVCASELTTGLIVQELQDPGIQNVIRDLTTDIEGHQIYFVPIRIQGTRSYEDLVAWGLNHHYTVIGLIREAKEFLNPHKEEILSSKDRAMLIGAERIPLIELD